VARSRSYFPDGARRLRPPPALVNEQLVRLAPLTPLVFAVLAVACDDDPPPPRLSAVPESAAPTTVVTPSGAPPVPVASATASDPAPAPAPEPLGSADASAVPSAEPSASAIASAPAPAASGNGLLGEVTRANEVKLGGPDGSPIAMIVDGNTVNAIFTAIGTTQKPEEGTCPGGIPTFQLGFRDRFGTRLGSLAVFAKEDGSLNPSAALRDTLGERCHTVTLSDPAALKRIIDAAAGRNRAAPPAGG
jgi:hypothetical protein